MTTSKINHMKDGMKNIRRTWGALCIVLPALIMLISAPLNAASLIAVPWTPLPGAANDIGVGANGAAWVIGTNKEGGGFGIYRWAGKTWAKVPGSAVRIAVGPKGNAWVVNVKNAIYRFDSREWVRMPGAARDIGIGANGAVWVVGTNKVGGGFGVWRWTGKTWAAHAGGLTNITVGPKGLPWGVNSARRIYVDKRALAGKQAPPKPIASKWVPYGGAYEPPVFTKEGNIVTATGLIKNGAYGHLWTVPKGMAPPQRLVFNINNHGKSARVDVLPDGKIIWVAGGRDHKWLSLSGIKYSVKPASKLRLASGWQPYGGAYAPPTFTKQGNLVTVSGLIKKGKHGHLATLPKGSTPRGRLIFNLNNHGKSARIDVLPDGKIVWVAGGKDHGWLSLSGIAFNVAPSHRPKLVNGWVPYGKNYATAMASRQGNLVTVSGLIKSGKHGHMAKLPKGFAPAKRVIFTVNNHANQARVDVLPDGRILWVAGAKDHGWMSLAGIAFKTNQAPATAPPAAKEPKLTVVSGNGQKVKRSGSSPPGGVAKFAPLVVALTDASGKPWKGANVRFNCGAKKPARMACQLVPAGGRSVMVKTDAQGRATLNKMSGKSVSAYYASGNLPIEVAADRTKPITITLVVLDPPPPPKPIAGAKMEIVSGNNQEQARRRSSSGPPRAGFAPLVVKVTKNNKPIPNARIVFTCQKPGRMACQMEPSGASPATVNTNAKGIATMAKMGGKGVSAYYADGRFTVTAAYGKAIAKFNLAVDPKAGQGDRYTLKIVKGNKQKVKRAGSSPPGGVAKFAPLVAALVDRAGKPVKGAVIRFSCGAKKPARMACQLSPAGGRSLPVRTDSRGQATLKQMGGKSVSAYYASGNLPIEIAADDAKPISFTLTVLDPPPPPKPIAGAVMKIVSGNNQKAARVRSASGPPRAGFPPLQVQVTKNGKPIPNARIVFTCKKPSRMACQMEPSGASPATTKTNAKGIATMAKMGGKGVSAYYADGKLSVTAAYGKATATFNLVVGK